MIPKLEVNGVSYSYPIHSAEESVLFLPDLG